MLGLEIRVKGQRLRLRIRGEGAALDVRAMVRCQG